MENSENETIIILNKADIREGFFRFSTSSKVDFSRLCKRIGGEQSLRKLTLSTQENGVKIVEWICEVPIEFLSMTTFGIRMKNKMSFEERKKKADRARELFKGKYQHIKE